MDVTRKPGPEEEALMDIVTGSELPVIIALNKVDICPESGTASGTAADVWQLLKLRRQSVSYLMRKVSALTGSGLEELKTDIFNCAPEGEALYPPDFYTDQSPEFRISEIIREQAMLRSRQELPHAIYVDVHEIEVREEQRHLLIRAHICVESKSQIGLVVGRNGSGIREIRKESQREAGKIFPYRIYLDLRVKCSPRWRRNEQVTRKLIQ